MLNHYNSKNMKRIILILFIVFLTNINFIIAQNPSINPNLEFEVRESINEQCVHKVKAFTDHLSKIATKIENDSIKEWHIEACMDLFVGRGNDTKDSEGNVIIPAPRIEVTSLANGTKNSYFIKNYLKRLKNLEYTKIVFKTSKCYMASGGIKKIRENEWSAIVTYYQVFIGYNGDMIVYRDKTQKNVRITITRDETGRFDVLLGDITAEQTTLTDER